MTIDRIGTTTEFLVKMTDDEINTYIEAVNNIIPSSMLSVLRDYKIASYMADIVAKEFLDNREKEDNVTYILFVQDTDLFNKVIISYMNSEPVYRFE